MNGQTSTCHYHKYGYCRDKNECQRFHSIVICSKTNCDIKNCRDRHPQQCKFFESQEFCKFGDSCMYDHRATDQKKSLKAEFEDLQKRFEEVIKVTSRHEETIRFLQYKLDMMGKQMIGAVREMSEHIEYIEDVTREDEKIEQMEIEHTKKDNLDDSYDIYSDTQFKEIMERQKGIASRLKNNLNVIQLNLKKKKVEETVASLAELSSLVQNDEKQMKQMLGKDIRYVEYYKDEQEAVSSCDNDSVATGYSDDDSDDDDYWKPKMDEMFKLFYEMMKNIENLPGNNFKKGAELEMQKMKEIAEQMERERDDEICLKFEPYIKKTQVK